MAGPAATLIWGLGCFLALKRIDDVDIELTQVVRNLLLGMMYFGLVLTVARLVPVRTPLTRNDGAHLVVLWSRSDSAKRHAAWLRWEGLEHQRMRPQDWPSETVHDLEGEVATWLAAGSQLHQFEAAALASQLLVYRQIERGNTSEAQTLVENVLAAIPDRSSHREPIVQRQFLLLATCLGIRGISQRGQAVLDSLPKQSVCRTFPLWDLAQSSVLLAENQIVAARETIDHLEGKTRQVIPQTGVNLVFRDLLWELRLHTIPAN